MKRRRFGDEPIIGILKEQEAGSRTADMHRRHGISEATFHTGKAKTPSCGERYGQEGISPMPRLR